MLPLWSSPGSPVLTVLPPAVYPQAVSCRHCTSLRRRAARCRSRCQTRPAMVRSVTAAAAAAAPASSGSSLGLANVQSRAVEVRLRGEREREGEGADRCALFIGTNRKKCSTIRFGELNFIAFLFTYMPCFCNVCILHSFYFIRKLVI